MVCLNNRARLEQIVIDIGSWKRPFRNAVFCPLQFMGPSCFTTAVSICQAAPPLDAQTIIHHHRINVNNNPVYDMISRLYGANQAKNGVNVESRQENSSNNCDLTNYALSICKKIYMLSALISDYCCEHDERDYLIFPYYITSYNLNLFFIYHQIIQSLNSPLFISITAFQIKFHRCLN